MGWMGPRTRAAMILARGVRWINDAQIRKLQYSTASQFCRDTVIDVGSNLPGANVSSPL